MLCNPGIAFFLLLSLTLPGCFVSLHAHCFDAAGAYYNISPEILRAIASVESSQNHSSINVNKNGSYDMGLMQINSLWRPILGETLWTLAYYDACWNTYVGAYILSQCIYRHDYTWKAVGCYHSGTPKLANSYISKVFRELQRNRSKHQHPDNVQK